MGNLNDSLMKIIYLTWVSVGLWAFYKYYDVIEEYWGMVKFVIKFLFDIVISIVFALLVILTLIVILWGLYLWLTPATPVTVLLILIYTALCNLQSTNNLGTMK